MPKAKEPEKTWGVILVYDCGKMPTVFGTLEEIKRLMRSEPKIIKVLDLYTSQCMLRREQL